MSPPEIKCRGAGCPVFSSICICQKETSPLILYPHTNSHTNSLSSLSLSILSFGEHTLGQGLGSRAKGKLSAEPWSIVPPHFSVLIPFSFSFSFSFPFSLFSNLLYLPGSLSFLVCVYTPLCVPFARHTPITRFPAIPI